MIGSADTFLIKEVFIHSVLYREVLLYTYISSTLS